MASDHNGVVKFNSFSCLWCLCVGLCVSEFQFALRSVSFVMVQFRFSVAKFLLRFLIPLSSFLYHLVYFLTSGVSIIASSSFFHLHFSFYEPVSFPYVSSTLSYSCFPFSLPYHSFVYFLTPSSTFCPISRIPLSESSLR